MSEIAQLGEPRAYSLIRQMLAALGLDIDTDPELLDTPRRWYSLLEDFCHGYTEADLLAIIKEGFVAPKQGGMVVQSDIPFRGMCAHHLAPYFGVAHIGYIPNRRVVGLSKMARLVDAAGTSRPWNQESTTNLIADTLHSAIDAQGTIVVTRAQHSCMFVRGPRAVGTTTSVSALRGLFLTVPAARSEFFELVKAH